MCSNGIIETALATAAFWGPLLPITVLVTVWLSIRFRSIRRAFFVSRRVGKSAKLFKHYQFRTLEKTNAAGNSHPIGFRGLLIWVGLDQLPALWNVTTGDMSLIGPYAPYARSIKAQASYDKTTATKVAARMCVRPGLFDHAHYDALTRPEQYRCSPSCLEIHYQYVKNWSLALDLGIALEFILLFAGFQLPNGIHFFNSEMLPPNEEVYLAPPEYMIKRPTRTIVGGAAATS